MRFLQSGSCLVDLRPWMVVLVVTAGCDAAPPPETDAGDRADAPASCAAGETRCGADCVDTQMDPDHCGRCDAPCAAGEVCASGACALSCPPGQDECGGGCVDQQTSRAHCGACDAPCDPGEICVAGACELSCGGGLTDCSGVCRDLETDRQHCGDCTRACAAGEICVAGDCELSCPAGQTACGATCHDLMSDPSHCGACPTACAPGEVCSLGTCAGSCAGTLTDCSGACVDTDHDPMHCGSCTGVCAAPPGAVGVCVAGGCRTICDTGRADCNGDLFTAGGNGCETDVANDPTNCGECGLACSFPNATAACGIGLCAISSCDAGFDDCDFARPNGCETALATTSAHCGACGNACDPGEACQASTCVPLVGDDCASAVTIVPGMNTVDWFAFTNDYLTVRPACTSSAIAGPDVVLAYTATMDGLVTFSIAKPASQRWVAVVSTGACGSVTPEVACASEFTLTTMSGTFPITMGTTYYFYVADTTSGTMPLSDPLEITLTESGGLPVGEDCSSPVIVVPGTQTVDWFATSADYLTTIPSCGSTFALDGPDVVLQYTASVNGFATFSIPKPASQRWDLVVSSGPCGTLTPEVECVSEFTLPSLSGGFAITAGTQYYFYLRDTTSGTMPLSDPFDITITEGMPTCSPGVGGVVGSGQTRIATGVASFTESYVAVDASPTGWVYFGGNTLLYRIPKAGGTVEDVSVAAGVGSTQLGQDMLIVGNEIYTLDDRTSGIAGWLWRISTDGGATFIPAGEDYASFATPPGDDFRGIAAHGGTIFMITTETTTTAMTEIWSVPAGSPTAPVAATLLGTIPNLGCSGLAADSTYLYSACSTADEIVRIDRATLAVTSIPVGRTVSATHNSLHLDDTNGDGVGDVLYFNLGEENALYVCGAGTASPFLSPVPLSDWGGATSNHGLGFDPAANALWGYDDDTRELLRIQ
jgi:hypothetical protein